MKIIEGLKELKLINAKIESNLPIITKYASALNIEKPQLGSDDAHRKEVASIIQSSEDLVKRYIQIKSCIDYTNLKTRVPMKDGKVYTITELLLMKRTTIGILRTVYDSVNDHAATRRRSLSTADKSAEVQIVRFYDEREIDEKKKKLIELFYEIDGTLEIINATTELLEEIA